MGSESKYFPKFELWFNSILWQAVFNVVNSFNVLEYLEEREPGGHSRGLSKVPDDVFIRRVLVLRALMPESFEKLGDYPATNEAIKGQLEQGKIPSIIDAMNLFRAIIKVLQLKHVIRVKPARDPAE